MKAAVLDTSGHGQTDMKAAVLDTNGHGQTDMKAAVLDTSGHGQTIKWCGRLKEPMRKQKRYYTALSVPVILYIMGHTQSVCTHDGA
jgi:hypothetical protein